MIADDTRPTDLAPPPPPRPRRGELHGADDPWGWADSVDVVEETRTVVVRTFTSQETGKTGKAVPMLEGLS